MTTNREIRSLTGLRGFAALYVAFAHYVFPPTPGNPFANLMRHGYLAVDLFFILSGFVMALTYRHLFQQTSRLWPSYFKFLGRRMARVYPLYLAGTIVAFIIFRAHMPIGTTSTAGLNVLLSNLAMVQTWILYPSLDLPGWSISSEWAAYLLFPSILTVAYFKNTPGAWLNLILCLLVCGASCFYVVSRATSPFTGNFVLGSFLVLRCLLEFALGILVLRCYTTAVETYLVARPWIATGTAVVIVALLALPHFDYVVILLFAWLILSLIPGNSHVARLLSSSPIHYLGVLSYSIYIVHTLLSAGLAPAHRWAQNYGLAHAQTYAAIAGVTASILLSILTHRLIEVPGRTLLRRLFEGPTAPAPVDT